MQILTEREESLARANCSKNMDAIERACADSEGEVAALLDNSGDEQPPTTSRDGTLEAIRGMENKMVDTLRNFAETLTTRLSNLAPKRRSRSSLDDEGSSLARGY